MSDSSLLREAFKVRIGDYLSEHEIEGLGVSADWFLYLSPTIAPALATCFTQFNTYKLLACPCCGGTATIIGTYPTNEFSAICRDCGLETAHKLTPKDAASNWNKRHAPDEGPAGIKTPEPNQMDAMLTDKPQNATIVPCDVCRQPNRIGHDCTPPESGGQGEAVAWTWRHPEGDSGNWWPNTPDYEAYKARVQSHGCTIQYAYTHPPAQASGAVTEADQRDAARYRALREHWVQFFPSLGSPGATHIRDGELDRQVDSLAQGGGNER